MAWHGSVLAIAAMDAGVLDGDLLLELCDAWGSLLMHS